MRVQSFLWEEKSSAVEHSCAACCRTKLIIMDEADGLSFPPQRRQLIFQGLEEAGAKASAFCLFPQAG